MWLALKLAAGKAKMPSDALLLDQLGSPEDVRKYKKWVRDYPEVERGPDQPIGDHYQALTKAFEDENAQMDENQPKPDEPRRGLTLDDPSQAPEVKLRAEPRKVTSPVRSTDEILADQTREQPPTDLHGMPRRIPGLNTGDSWAHSVPPEWVPRPVPLPNRTPGTHYVDPAIQAARPQPRQQTTEEWRRGLADKGIFLNDDLTRMTPEQLPRRPLTGPQIWEPFTRPSPAEYTPRHRAAMVAYVASMLKTAGSHEHLTGAGWTPHGSGTGSYYHKVIGDKVHVLANEPDGWIHNTGPAAQKPDEYGDYEMTGNPRWFDSIFGEKGALAHVNSGGSDFVGFKAVPPSIKRMNSTWRDEQ